MGNSESANGDDAGVEKLLENANSTRLLDISRRVSHSQFFKHLQGENSEACLSDLPWSVLDQVNFYERVDASFNSIAQFSQQIPYRLPHLVHLNLSYNLINSVPPCVGLLFHLKELLLRHNKLTSLPKELSQLSHLELLDVSHNQLETLPENLGNLPSLVSLNVSHNSLNTLPLSLGNCKTLKILLAVKNQCSRPSQEICDKGSEELIRYLRSHAPTVRASSYNQFRRVRHNTIQSPTLQDSRGLYSRNQTKTEEPLNRIRTPLLPPLDASKYEPEVLKDKIIGLVYGAILGDTLGVATEFLSRDEIQFYYGNDRLGHESILQDEHRAHFTRGEWTCVSDLMLLVLESMLQWAGVLDELDLARQLMQYKKSGLKDLHRGPPFITSGVLNAVLNESDFTADPHAVSERISNNLGQVVVEDLHVLPMALFSGVSFFHNLDEVSSTAERVCKTTNNHQHVKAAAGCLAAIIASILQGKSNDVVRSLALDSGSMQLTRHTDLELWWNSTHPDAYQANVGNALSVTSAALYCLSRDVLSRADFDDTLRQVLFRGGQSRLYGAVCGAVMGCQLGFSSLNGRWIEGLDPRHVCWLNERINLLLDIMGLP